MKRLAELAVQVAVIAAIGYAAYQVCRPCWPIVYTERVKQGAEG